MSTKRLFAILSILALCTVTSPAAAQEFKLIVNPGNSTTELPAAVAAKIFLKETAAFPNGAGATPVDQAKASPVRAAFSKSVVGRPVNAIEMYWQQQIFSGKELPPPTKATDDDVIAFVKATPGGIGYVSAGASVAGVKVVSIK